MSSRRWDVSRAAASIAVVVASMTACGPARLAAPPTPEFTSAKRAEPTVPTTDIATEATHEPILPDEVEADVPAEVQEVPVDQLVVVDDAGNAAPNRSGWDAFDDALRTRLIPSDVSASVAVMVDGQMVHRAAFGERIAGSDDPADVDDRFRIASISKTITAIVTMQLVEAGTLSLDEPVGQIVIDHLGLTAWDADAPGITVRELLSHTSGFPQGEGIFFGNGASSCMDAARQGLAGPISSGGFRYSNMNYCVLGLLIEAVTGHTYERVAHENLLTPLGIGGMRMASTYDLGPDEVSHHPTPGRNYMETLGAAGAWNATPGDLVTILNSIDPDTPGWKAVGPETASAMRYRVPAAAPPSGYGLGIINYDGGAYGHTGTIEHTHAMVVTQPDGVTWAITVSGEDPGDTPQLRTIVRQAFVAGFGT